MRFLVLGPLEVTGDRGEPLPVSGTKERTILADLIAHGDHVVSVDDLIEEVWGEDPPKTAEKTLGSYVSRLRRALEPNRDAGAKSDVITTRGDGYQLEVDEIHEIDAVRFERLAADGRRLLGSGHPRDAASVLEDALNLWRGDAYQGYRYTGFGTSEGERLEELRRSALENQVETRLANGDAAALIPDLEAMVRDEPLRERRWSQLMLALYRAGRQAEALQAFIRARTVLVDELGIEPGPDLQRLQTAILAQDPALEGRWPIPQVEVVNLTDVCPFKGLARFETSDAEFFFGREHVVAEAVGRLVGGRFLALVGPSGSGKSSLMRAGLIHALESGAIPGSHRWTHALMRPGNHPLEALDAAFEIQGSPKHSVLAIDQFEEAFTACSDPAERTAFLDSITEAALAQDGAVTVILAMRADYYGRCVEHRGLASLLASSQILVGPMNETELRRAIELPADRAGLTVEEQLTDALVTDTVNQPGGLPLLSTALLEIWTHRRDRALRVDDYLRTGGVEGAVARMAEEAFGRLDVDGQASAKRILLRLAGSGEGSDVVRRRAPLTEFDLERDAEASRALAALTSARLVTVADGTAEVAHEALLRDWPRLRTWLEDDAEGRRLHSHVTASAHTWEESRRDEGDLYRGARLTGALDWADSHEPDLNTSEREFLEASRAASVSENLRARRTNRRLRALLVGVAVLLVLSLVTGNLALTQRNEARAAADVADSRELARRSLAADDTVVSLLLAREAVGLDDSAQTRSALLTALQRDPAAIAEMHSYGATLGDLTEWLQLSPDGRVIATGGARTTVDFFDAITQSTLGQVDVGAPTTTGDFSPDSGLLAVAAVDQRIVGINVGTRRIDAIEAPGREIDAVQFSPQGGLLLTAESKDGEGVLVARDPVTFEATSTPVRSATGVITAMASSLDGRRLVTTDLPPSYEHPGGHTVLWNERTLAPIGDPFPWGGNDIALSPDGGTVAIAVAESEARSQVDDLKGHLWVLNLRTGQTKRREGLAPGQGGAIGLTGLAFSADGESLISTGDDGRVLNWNVSTAQIHQAYADPSGLMAATPAISPDGTKAFTIDVDGNIVVWDLKGDERVGQSFSAGSGAYYWPYFAVSPGGGTLAIIQRPSPQHGSVQLVDTSTLATQRVISYNRFGFGFPQAVAFSPDGRSLAIASYFGYVQLWDVDTGKQEGPPFHVPGLGADRLDFWITAFSPDGSLLATGGSKSGANSNEPDAGVVFLWNTARGRLVRRLPKQAQTVNNVNFTPDGKTLVVSTGIGGVGDAIVWNVGDGSIEGTIHADDTGIYWADISDDGRTLVTAGESGRERLWDLAAEKAIGPPIKGPNTTVDLSRDGRTLVAAGPGGQVMMWDVATGWPIGRWWVPGSTSEDDNLAAAFTPDGRRLFIVSETGRAWVWDMDPASWEARACQIAGRSLSEAEWSVNLPDRPYDPTCSS